MTQIEKHTIKFDHEIIKKAGLAITTLRDLGIIDNNEVNRLIEKTSEIVKDTINYG